MATVSAAICTALVRSGVTAVWTLGSALIDGLLAPAREHPLLAVEGISVEKDAAFAADGATRVSHAPGAAAMLGSVGLASALVGIQTAVLERRPVLFLIGQVDRDAPELALQDTRATGFGDAAVMAASGCRSWSVHSAAELAAAWPDVVTTLADRRPAALLVDESVFASPLADELADLPRHDPSPAPAPPSAIVPILGGPLSRSLVLTTLVQAVPDLDVFIDAGQSRHVGMALVADGLPLRMHHCPRSASLGWAVAAALGAAMHTGRRMVAVCGDGGLMMSLQALADVGQRAAPVTIVVAVNGILGVDAARYEVPDDLRLPDVDVAAVAVALRVPARVVGDAQDLAAALSDQAAGPKLVVVPVPAFEDAVEEAAVGADRPGSTGDAADPRSVDAMWASVAEAPQWSAR